MRPTDELCRHINVCVGQSIVQIGPKLYIKFINLIELQYAQRRKYVCSHLKNIIRDPELLLNQEIFTNIIL